MNKWIPISLLVFLGMFWAEDFWAIALVMTLYSFFWNASLPQFEVVTFSYLKERVERGFTFLKMDISINLLKDVEGGLTWPKGQGGDPQDQYSGSDYSLVEHPFTGIRITDKGLKVMDATAISLCMDNDLPIVVFNLTKRGNIRRVVLGEEIGTVVRPHGDADAHLDAQRVVDAVEARAIIAARYTVSPAVRARGRTISRHRTGRRDEGSRSAPSPSPSAGHASTAAMA